MLLIRCPYCEEDRPELEFRNAGEAHVARSPAIAGISDADFEAFFFIRSNPKGVIYERWRHIHGCGRFFNAQRDSVTDKFFQTYKAGVKKPPLPKTAAGMAHAPAAWENVPPAELNADKPASKPRATRKGDA